MFDLTRRNLFQVAMAAATMPKYQIIDPHVHVWKHDPQYPFAKGQKVPDRDATPETLLGLMKENGVSKTVIIQVIHYRYDNSFLADVLKRYPQYFRGVARVDPLDPGNADHLSRLTEEQHFHGVRISPSGGAAGDWINGPLMPPLWEHCQKLGVPMTILAPVTRMPDIGKLADRFPGLTIVIDHMADSPVDQPEQLEKLIALKRHPKLFVKISHTWSLSKRPYPWPDSQQLVKRLYDAYGPQRLMWATDWPIVEATATYRQALTVVRDEMKFLNDEDKSWMMNKTIQRVWPFG